MGEKNFRGGGIFAMELPTALKLSRCHFKGNIAGMDGGAILYFGRSLHINETTFLNNSANIRGGAIFVQDRQAILKLSWCHFKGNIVFAEGGAIAFFGHSLYINDTTFLNNSAESGGALHSNLSNVYTWRSSFTGNRCTSFGGAVRHFGKQFYAMNTTFKDNFNTLAGGALFAIPYSQLTFILCHFKRNTARNGQGGAISTFKDTTLDILQCEFISNRAGEGGAIFQDIFNYTIARQINSTNSLLYRIYLYDLQWKNTGTQGKALSISNCLFERNQTTLGDPYNRSRGSMGGAVYIGYRSNVTISSCNFHRNTATFGGAIIYFRDKLFVIDTKFVYNFALGYGTSKGGALSTFVKSEVYIFNCFFKGNWAYWTGGAISHLV